MTGQPSDVDEVWLSKQARRASRPSGAADRLATLVRHRQDIGLCYLVTTGSMYQLYDELWDQQRPTATAHLRAAVARSRAFAGRRGWAPPLAWDDDTIDDPAAEPNTGERGTAGIDLAEVDHLSVGGCSIAEIARRMGVAEATITTARWRAKGRAS